MFNIHLFTATSAEFAILELMKCFLAVGGRVDHDAVFA